MTNNQNKSDPEIKDMFNDENLKGNVLIILVFFLSFIVPLGIGLFINTADISLDNCAICDFTASFVPSITVYTHEIGTKYHDEAIGTLVYYVWLTILYIIFLMIYFFRSSFKDYPMEELTILNVPFSEKDEAKSMGARWNPNIKKWYVPTGVNASLFER